MSSDSTSGNLPPPRPGPTYWQNICSVCDFQLNYVPHTRSYYLNHWEIHLGYPIAVLFVIFSSYIEAIMCLRLWRTRPLVTWYETVTMVFFAWSYIRAVYLGPGYLTIFYPEKTPPLHPQLGADYLSGMAVTDEQRAYAKDQQFPIRTKFFKSARRVVIRPDHLCAWLASFVGKRNHKLFFLFNFWGIMYISCHIILSSIEIIETFADPTRRVTFAIQVMYLALAISFLWLTGSFFVQNVKQIHQNRTQFEIMADIPANRFRVSPWWKNWEEVFGSRNQWYLWLLPIQAFGGMDDVALAHSLAPTIHPLC